MDINLEIREYWHFKWRRVQSWNHESNDLIISLYNLT